MSDMTMRVRLDLGAFMPRRAHPTDAGADILTPETFTVGGHSSEIVATGVHVELAPGTVGLIKSKSGLNMRNDITSEGVIDEGYDGEIVVKLYNHGPNAHRFRRGDKITQLLVMPVLYPDFEEAEEIGAGERGSDGFGSTGA